VILVLGETKFRTSSGQDKAVRERGSKSISLHMEGERAAIYGLVYDGGGKEEDGEGRQFLVAASQI
jgi:hypothetical protein